MKKLIVGSMLLCLSCKSSVDKTKDDSFYDSSNYYIKNSYLINDSISNRERNSPYSLENFILLNSVDFLYGNIYDFYLIFLKDYFFQNRNVIFKVKSYKGIVTFSKCIITSSKGDYLFHDKNILKRFSGNVNIEEKIWTPQKDTFDIVAQKTNILIRDIHTDIQPLEVINDNYSEALIYDGNKYYIVNTSYVDLSVMLGYESFLLDSILSLDVNTGYSREKGDRKKN